MSGRALRTIFAALTAVFCLGAAGCTEKTVSPPLTEGFRLDDPEKAGLPVLEIADHSFTNTDFARYVRLTVGEEGSSLNAEEAGRLFDEFIGYKLAAHRAAGQNVALSEEEKTRILEESLPTPDAEGGSVPKAAPEDLLEAALVEKYWSRQVNGLAVGPEEISSYFESHKDEFIRPERFRVSQIMVSSEAKAEEILGRLRTAGESLFRRTAKEESEAPEAAKGGLMGVFSAGQLPPELEALAFSLDEGRISRVIQTEYGFHILRLDKKLPAGLMEYAEAAPLIRAGLIDNKKQAAMAAHLSFLKDSLPWKVETKNLPFVYQRGS